MLSLIEFNAEESRVDNGGKKYVTMKEEKKIKFKKFSYRESRDRK